MTPSVEHSFNGIVHIPQLGDMSVMSNFSPRNLPKPLNGIKFMAVGRHVIQRKPLMTAKSPFSIEFGHGVIIKFFLRIRLGTLLVQFYFQ